MQTVNQVKMTQFSNDTFNELLQVIFFLVLFMGFPSSKCYHGHCSVTLICLYNSCVAHRDPDVISEPLHLEIF